MRKHSLHNDYRPVNDYTEVYGTQTHEICRNAEDAHQYESEEHCQRNYRCHNETRPEIAKKEHQHHKDYQSSLNKVSYHCTYVAVYEFRTVKVRLNCHTFRQHLLHFLYTLLQFFCHHIGVGSLEHHGNAAYALAFAVHGHCAETFWRTEIHLSYVADVYGHTVAVCHHNLLNVLRFGNHSLGTYIVRPVLLLNITCSRVLVVVAQCLEHVGERYLQG